MARSRNIKPGFFTNEELVELNFSTRLLFIGLWTIADRAGRLEDRPKKIKMSLFPADNIDIDSELNALQNSGFIVRYEIEGNKYIQILAFEKHQNPHKEEKASTIPAPCKHHASTMQTPCKHDGNRALTFNLIPDSLIPDSLIPDSLIPDSAPIGATPTSVGVCAKKPKKTGKPEKTTLPDGFFASEVVLSWYRKNGYTEDIRQHIESFCEKCKAKAYVYADWDAALKTAIRDDWAKLRSPNGNRGSPNNGASYHLTEAQKRSENSRMAAQNFLTRNSVIDGEVKREN